MGILEGVVTISDVSTKNYIFFSGKIKSTRKDG